MAGTLGAELPPPKAGGQSVAVLKMVVVSASSRGPIQAPKLVCLHGPWPL